MARKSMKSHPIGNSERIGYFGGTFDPPHRGHLAVARAARDHFQLDRVLLAPTGRQPLKPDGPAASWNDRYRMTELLCAGQPGLEASTIDGPRPNGEPNYTADTLRRLHLLLAADQSQESPQSPAKIFAILGADAFLGLSKWREPEALFRLAEWIIVSRPGTPPSEIDAAGSETREPPPAIHPLNCVHDPVSATDLRRRLHTGEPCQDLLPAPVLDYIRLHGLYTR
ncbi:MAG: nicotinate (nicotinamide) nucleotide adenylyltransferase [Janthinobacterium lividum]